MKMDLLLVNTIFFIVLGVREMRHGKALQGK